ncbi:alpha/beta hydrolase [Paenibacillus paeoniae]|uniref:Alpha/beta hydrolase n=1 Tax=Paenibacillus paeoniae TaxID=2292705 RepID=A0A371PNB4_9BACL|nr:alpha/beta hydrolase [Paenibacillus paeoniae]REK77700.1 alpha/beta hydrolase [Paenibacillus paeoniae]
MKKWLRILLKSLAVILILIVAFIAIVYIVNVVSTKSEKSKIQAYGQLVPVDGKNMNVLIQGEGEDTIVLLPGYGTASPVLDFKPLIDELSPYYKVVAIEPFGYGLSDTTDKDRTTENIVKEIHEALQSLNIDRYILMGHSITGLYGVDYVSKYRDEVTAFIGIDTSIPTQGGMDVEFPIGKFKLLKSSGFARLMMKFNPDPYEGLPYDDETREQIRLIQLQNMFNPSILNEMEHISSNFKEATHMKFPVDLPLLLLVGKQNISDQWVPIHEEQAASVENGKIVIFDASHYVHHTKFKEIVENSRQFMADIK